MVYEGYQDYFDKPVIVSVAVTGGIHGKEANPNLPTQPEEIGEAVAEAEEAGAAVAHIHGRDEDGENTKSVERFQEIRDELVKRCDDIVINFTAGGSELGDYRIQPSLQVEPQPELATLDLGPLNAGYEWILPNTRKQNEEFARKLAAGGVKPELEVFNPGHFPEMQYLIDEGLLEKPYWTTLILGMQNGTPPHPRNLLNMVDNLPEDSEWQCLAVGKNQLPLTTMAMILGGHVRVGLEDNIYYRKGELAESSAQLVRRAVRIAKELNRPVASPDEAREIIGI